MPPASCLPSPEMPQGRAGMQGQEVVRVWGKTGQGTWLVLFCSTPLTCLYTRFYSWLKYLCVKCCVSGVRRLPSRALGRRAAIRARRDAGMLPGWVVAASRRDARPAAGSAWVHPELGPTGTWVPSEQGASPPSLLPKPTQSWQLSETRALASIFQCRRTERSRPRWEASSHARRFPLLFVLSVRIVNYSGMKPEISLKCLAQESPLGATGIKMQDASELNFCPHIENSPLLTSPWSDLFILCLFTVCDRLVSEFLKFTLIN